MLRYVLLLLWIFPATLSACRFELPTEPSPATSPTPDFVLPTPTTVIPAASPDAPLDLLAEIQARGYLRVGVRTWRDPQLTAPLFRNAFGALDGYEVGIIWEIANALDVDVEMVETYPPALTRGDWQGEFDMAVGWLTPTDQAQQTLIFSDPYAYDPQTIWVHESNAASDLSDFTGERVGVPAFTVYQEVFARTPPSLGGVYLNSPLPNEMLVVPYVSRLDMLSALTNTVVGSQTLQAATLSSFTSPVIQDGNFPVTPVLRDWYSLPVAVAFDRNGLPPERLRLLINQILARKRQDGSLAELAYQWLGQDITRPPK